MNKRFKKYLIGSIAAVAVMLSAFTNIAYAQSKINAQNYEIYTGDYNGDGLTDILLKAIPSTDFAFLLVDEISLTIPVNANLINFILEQQANGSYILIADPPQADVDHSSWVLAGAQDFDFFHGDFNGDGLIDTLIRSTNPVIPSFIILSASDLAATSLSQVINSNDFTVSFADGTIEILDINNDGRDDIRLTLGANSADIISNPDGTVQESSGNPNPGPTTDYSAPAENPYSLTNGVGAIPGNFNVSSTGRANYRIPLRIPPSIQNIAPEFALNYSGQNFNDVFGVGWFMEGVSEITRCGTTIVQEGYIDGVNFNASDKFCLNGQKLIAVTGSYGANGTVYRTETESHSRIVSTSSGTNPSSFTVHRPDGTIETYGGGNSTQTDSSGANIYAWKISQLKDRQENYVTFNYTKNAAAGKHQLQSIQYTGNFLSQLTPQNEIKLIYGARTDVIRTFSDSHFEQIDERVTRIEIWLKGSKIREYRLGYTNASGTAMSLLNSIQDCPIVGATEYCIPATTFAWGAFNNLITFSSAQTSTDTSSYPNGNQFDDQKYHIGDVDGDGQDDLIWTYLDSSNNRLGRVLWLADADGNGFTFESKDEDTGFLAASVDLDKQEYLTGDFNGDGKTDLVYVANFNNEVF